MFNRKDGVSSEAAESEKMFEIECRARTLSGHSDWNTKQLYTSFYAFRVCVCMDTI